MNKCYFTRTAYQQFHMPLQILHKQFSRQCLCKGLVKGQKSQGRVLTKAHISPSIKLSTQLNLYSTLEPSFSANIRQHVRCVGKDKSTTKAHMSHLLQNDDTTTTAWAWQPQPAGDPLSKHATIPSLVMWLTAGHRTLLLKAMIATPARAPTVC